MYRKYYLVEVVLLLLLSHGGWNGPSVTLLSCTSESSKLVRDVVEKRFLSVVERYRVSLPLECPLHPKRDMFWWLQPDIQATRREGEQWHCPVCGRTFGCENTFVTHWDVTHSRTLLGMAGETVCLDDYCDVFRCDVLKRKMLRMRLEEEDELRKHHPAGSQGISIFQHRDSEENEEVKEKKRNCDPRAMNQVHHKCRSLIRQCTLGMVANLSSKDFEDIEEDLDQSLCSFLTCDKYWDDFDPHIHRVPVLVFAVFGLLITSLFCFCYYGLWVLLEKSPINSNQMCYSCQKSSSIDGYYRMKRQKHRQKQNSPEYTVKPNSLEYATQKNLNDYTSKKYSPENAIKQLSSPESNTKLNSNEYNRRKNIPEINSRQNSPEYNSRDNSPEYNSRENSPEYNSRKNFLECNSRKNSPEYNSREKSPEYISRQNSPEYDTQRSSFEYNTRRTSPEYNSKQNSQEYFSKRISSEYHSRENSPEYNSRETSPEFEDRQNSPEFECRQNSPEFDFRPHSLHNLCYQNSSKYKQKSMDIHQRKRPQISSSQSANTLNLPQKHPIRVINH